MNYEPTEGDWTKGRAWKYVGPRFWMEGVPFGGWVDPGDYYTAVTPITPDDIDLQAALDECRAALIARESDAPPPRNPVALKAAIMMLLEESEEDPAGTLQAIQALLRRR